MQQVSDMKASLEFNQQEIDEQKNKLESMESYLSDVGRDIDNMQGSLGYQKDKMEYQYIRVTGIEEKEGKIWGKPKQR